MCYNKNNVKSPSDNKYSEVVLMEKYIAIYVRRSVSDKEKGNNSLSIPAQIAGCIRFVGEDSFYRFTRRTANRARI